MLRVVAGKAEVSQENKYTWRKKAHQRWNPGEQEHLKGDQKKDNLGIKNECNWLNHTDY